MTNSSFLNQRMPRWIAAIVILGAMLLTAGAVIALLKPALLVSPSDDINSAVHVYAAYVVSRNLAIAILLVLTLWMGAKRALSQLMVLTALVQMIDVLLDLSDGRWPIVPGITVFAVVFLMGASRLSGFPAWRREAWAE